ncbi:MFS transporter [Oryzifoliimicrobium ureilyticus]|uniref:MFS transporter n=1 Tax=Oryzifoliimicrobium ureilyticus TaxID=3113724 RepID=UPI0030765CB5
MTGQTGVQETDTAATKSASLGIALLVAGTFFMENLDATVITPAVPQMAQSFGVAPVELNAGISAYMLTLGIFIPVSGWIADRFGPRQVFAAAIALFTFASLLCGITNSLPTFIAARVLQGIGGAMMVPVGRLVVLRVTPKEKLISAIAALTWPALVAPVLGPPVGGLIADHADWRWIFYLNLPLGLIAMIIALKIVPAERDTKVGPFDWLGFAVTGASLFALMMAAEIAGRPDANFSLAALVGGIGALLLIASVVHLNRARAPMIELKALKVKTFAVTIWGGSLFRMGISAVPFLIPLMLQIGFGYDAFSSGLVLMAVFAGNLAMKPMTTAILRRFGFKTVLIGNGIINVLALSACASFTPAMPLPIICFVLFIGGMSRSMQFTALNTIAFADVSKEMMSGANTLFSAAFQLTVGLGIALGAIAWRFGEYITSKTGGPPVQPFQIAFMIIAATAVLALIDMFTLAANAGENVSKKPKKS